MPKFSLSSLAPRDKIQKDQQTAFGFGPFENVPQSAAAIMHYMDSINKVPFTFSIDCLPPTANHMYKHTRYGTRRTEQYRKFCVDVAREIYSGKKKFEKPGTAAFLIFLESPSWITKQNTVAMLDADNRVKTLLDAIKEATGVPDELSFEVHVWKVLSIHVRTTVVAYDLGNVVDFFGAIK